VFIKKKKENKIKQQINKDVAEWRVCSLARAIDGVYLLCNRAW
jgi:hypothetical protein